jgi:carboxymethylenebutenolidase
MNTSLCVRVLASSVLLVAVACPGSKDAPAEQALTLPSVLAQIPEQPVTADEGKPGQIQKLAAVQPATRVFVVEPAGEAPAPGVLLVHGVWGLDSETRNVARDLAAQGFLVVAPDLYDGLEPTSGLVTKEMLKAVTPTRNRATLDAALDLLMKTPRLQGHKHMLVGLGVGGQWAMPWLDSDRGFAAVAFDSSALMSTPPGPGYKGPMLLLCGAESMSFAAAARDSITKTYSDAGVQIRVHSIAGAGTDLFDAQAKGFSASARVDAMNTLVEFLKSSSR